MRSGVELSESGGKNFTTFKLRFVPESSQWISNAAHCTDNDGTLDRSIHAFFLPRVLCQRNQWYFNTITVLSASGNPWNNPSLCSQGKPIIIKIPNLSTIIWYPIISSWPLICVVEMATKFIEVKTFLAEFDRGKIYKLASSWRYCASIHYNRIPGGFDRILQARFSSSTWMFLNLQYEDYILINSWCARSCSLFLN